MRLSESTVRSFRSKSLDCLQKMKRGGDFSDVTSIVSKKRGRPLTLGKLDCEVQLY